jgi:hypothetical protein
MEAKEKYLKELEQTIDIQKELLSRLEKRVELLLQIDAGNKYDDNENQIVIIKTNAEINALKHILKEKHDYFVKYAAAIGKEFAELDEKFDAVIEEAKLKSDSNDKIKRLLNSVDINVAKSHEQSKLYLYNKLVSLINE